MTRVLLALLLTALLAAAPRAQLLGLTGVASRTTGAYLPTTVTAAQGQNVNTIVGTTLVDVPAGSFMVLYVADESTGAPGGSVADSAGNTWHSLPGTNFANNTANGFARIFYVFNSLHLPLGGTITYTLAQTVHSAAFEADMIPGVLASGDPIDVSGANGGNGTASTVSIAGVPAINDFILTVTFVASNASTVVTGDNWGIVCCTFIAGGGPGRSVSAAVGYWSNDANLVTHTNDIAVSGHDWAALAAAFKPQ